MTNSTGIPMPEALPLLLDYCVYAVRNQSKTAWLAESRRMSDRKILTPWHFRWVRSLTFTKFS